MQALPVIVGFGGYNAAGRSSSHQAFRRLVLESLSQEEQEQTIVSLACLMKLVSWNDQFYTDYQEDSLTQTQVAKKYKDLVLKGTLIRRLEDNLFDPKKVYGHKRVVVESKDKKNIFFKIAKRDLPPAIPSQWDIKYLDDDICEVGIENSVDFLIPAYTEQAAKAGGQLPTGFDPSAQYNSRFHPRGLQLALLGASDALASIGIPWEKIASSVHPDEVGVYGTSIMGQVSKEGLGGLLQARLLGERVTSKQYAMGLNTMPADFINAYVIGSVGHTAAITGACASFLYVLQGAVQDIKSGRRRVAIIGSAEAGLTPAVMEGFTSMGALGTDSNLCKLDSSKIPDWRNASRPFGENCGFTIGEASQYIILMDDTLAVDLGADVHGAVPDVYTNADGIKRSISAPGIGNYVSFAKAVASAVSIVGKSAVCEHSFIHAHGSSTPVNRVTESRIFDRVAKAFAIKDWPVTAAKAFVGHSLAAASGDQLAFALGTFKYNILPGIKTVDKIAEDVFQDRLLFPLEDLDLTDRKMKVAFINSKGFGGNNATAIVISPSEVEKMLKARHSRVYEEYENLRGKTRQEAKKYAENADKGAIKIVYRFGEELVEEENIEITSDHIKIPGYHKNIVFDKNNPWEDMC